MSEKCESRHEYFNHTQAHNLLCHTSTNYTQSPSCLLSHLTLTITPCNYHIIKHLFSLRPKIVSYHSTQEGHRCRKTFSWQTASYVCLIDQLEKREGACTSFVLRKSNVQQPAVGPQNPNLNIMHTTIACPRVPPPPTCPQIVRIWPGLGTNFS